MSRGTVLYLEANFNISIDVFLLCEKLLEIMSNCVGL